MCVELSSCSVPLRLFAWLKLAGLRPDLSKTIWEFKSSLLRLVPKCFSEPPNLEQDPSRVFPAPAIISLLEPELDAGAKVYRKTLYVAGCCRVLQGVAGFYRVLRCVSKRGTRVSMHRREINLIIRIYLIGRPFGRLGVSRTSLLE